MPNPHSLLEAQFLYVNCLGVWLPYVQSQGYRLTMGEQYVGDSIDKPGEDTPHKRKGAHFTRTGGDWNLWIREGGRWNWIQNGAHPAWREIGEKWESLDSLCFWGGRIGDANHVSVRWVGRV